MRARTLSLLVYAWHVPLPAASKSDRRQIVYLNFEDDRLLPIRPDELDLILRAHEELRADPSATDPITRHCLAVVGLAAPLPGIREAHQPCRFRIPRMRREA